jgi:proline dehydrogenase
MLRDTLLYLSNQPRVFEFVHKNRLAKHFAKRFVAGETLTEALDVVRGLNARGISASLDLLGESVTNDREARAARDEYIRILDRIRETSANANVSVKLTAMGLDIDNELCVAVMQDILARAQQHETFVRIDMEASAYTDVTLKLFEERLYPAYKANVGVVLQSYLYRTFADVEHMNSLRARVRLCKGAYREPPSVAYPEKKDVDANFVKCMRELMLRGNYPGIATHDPAMINEAKRWAKEQQIEKDRFEFQMLYGVRRDLQDALVRDGYRVRVYVPFGTQWYPYLMRRLAERPANVAFITGNVIREALHARRHR